jgi:PhnB protein
MHKPEGYPDVSAYIVAAGAQRVIAFMEQVFDATPLRRYDTPDGSIMHAEMRIGDSVIMIGESGAEWPPVPTFLHVYVGDVDATWQRAVAAGGEPVQPPERRGDDPDRRGGVRDPAGNTWWISTQIG